MEDHSTKGLGCGIVYQQYDLSKHQEKLTKRQCHITQDLNCLFQGFYNSVNSFLIPWYYNKLD